MRADGLCDLRSIRSINWVQTMGLISAVWTGRAIQGCWYIYTVRIKKIFAHTGVWVWLFRFLSPCYRDTGNVWELWVDLFKNGLFLDRSPTGRFASLFFVIVYYHTGEKIITISSTNKHCFPARIFFWAMSAIPLRHSVRSICVCAFVCRLKALFWERVLGISACCIWVHCETHF